MTQSKIDFALFWHCCPNLSKWEPQIYVSKLSLHQAKRFFFDDRGQGREVNEAKQAGKVSFADFYDNGRHIFLNIKIRSV